MCIEFQMLLTEWTGHCLKEIFLFAIIEIPEPKLSNNILLLSKIVYNKLFLYFYLSLVFDLFDCVLRSFEGAELYQQGTIFA